MLKKEEGNLMVKTFRVEGWFRPGGKRQKFTKEFRSTSKESVPEKLYSEMGSKHGIKRNFIHISNLEEIDPREAEDPLIRALAGVK